VYGKSLSQKLVNNNKGPKQVHRSKMEQFLCIFRATVSAVSCLFVPAFICIDLLVSCALKLNDDDDDELFG